MSISIWDVLQFVLTAFEIGACIWICDVVVYDGELVKKHKKFIVGWVTIVFILIAYNRIWSFFSWIAFLFQIFGIGTIIALKAKKNWIIVFVLTFDFNLLLSLFDLTLSFFAISHLNEKFWNKMYYTLGVESIVLYFISRFFVFILCKILLYYKKKNNFHIESYREVLFLVGTIGCVWCWCLLLMLDDYSKGIRFGNSFFIITCLIILISFMVMELKNTNLKTQTQLITMKKELLEQNYNNLHNLYKSNQYVYHDFKNHMLILNNYLELNKYEEASSYIRKIIRPVEKLNNFIRSGCDILDLVLNIKEEEARQKRIKYQVNIDTGIIYQMNKNDLGNMFFNLLDNAIEACEKIEHRDKWIHITIKRKNQLQIIKIENSIEKPIHTKNGEYVTDKKDKEFHSIGMKSVEASVNKYGGNVQWSHTDKVFIVVITFFENEL